MVTNIQIEQAIDRLVKQGRVIRIIMPNGELGIKLVKECPSSELN